MSILLSAHQCHSSRSSRWPSIGPFVGESHFPDRDFQDFRESRCSVVGQFAFAAFEPSEQRGFQACEARGLWLRQQLQVPPVAEISLTWIGDDDIFGANPDGLQGMTEQIDLGRRVAFFPSSDRFFSANACEARDIATGHSRSRPSRRKAISVEAAQNISAHVSNCPVLIARHDASLDVLHSKRGI